MASSLPEGYLPYFKAWEEKIGAFIEFKDDVAEKAPGALPFAVKDNIAVKGFSISCGSKLLAPMKSPYTATVVQKLEALGNTVIGKTNMDEFGMGSSTDNSAIKRTNNPWDQSRVSGGSSGGSAAAVAAGLVPYALGSDTGGSIRQPAAFCGVVGLKPTYGAVSRFGLVAYASSLETIGVLADTTKRCRAVFAAIRGGDPLDQTSQDAPAGAPALYREVNDKNTPRTIGVLSPEAIAKAISSELAAGNGDEEAALQEAAKAAAQAAVLEDEVARGFELAKTRLQALGHTLVDIEIPSLKYGVPAYYTIATAEASANLARFDSIRYGLRPDWAENPDDLIDKARDAGFGPEVKLRILLGTFVLRSGFQDRYYLRAQRIRAGIRRNFEAYLGSSDYAAPQSPNDAPHHCDAILLPVFPTRAFGRGDLCLSPFAQKAADLYTCCANLAGLPALAFPVGGNAVGCSEGGLPVGVQLIGRAFAEGTLLDIVDAYESAHPFPHPGGYKSFWSQS
ncbi:glutamyl-tRNA(Gln) amidotransferase subunit A [Spirochaetia bacterium]|nr:glutamyl-tRNA(Gln) amidotransferase subunit A [Spirochaetia bacterium]